MLATFTYANLAVKFSAVNLLNFGVMIYLLWIGILFSAAVRAVVVAKLLMLGVLFLISFVLALRALVVAN